MCSVPWRHASSVRLAAANGIADAGAGVGGMKPLMNAIDRQKCDLHTGQVINALTDFFKLPSLPRPPGPSLPPLEM